jgi:hypothetical protein
VGPVAQLVASLQNPALPKAGVAPDGNAAGKIAEAAWTPVYGADMVASQKPFKAELSCDVWKVTGSSKPEAALFAFILRIDGRFSQWDGEHARCEPKESSLCEGSRLLVY